ncbi:NAD(P)-dependent oxidoreductase [Alphaproteobacteria bacterium]|nr:NAD(P)-dependent oxidoreductase [Alphaproteobacteria bacterium]
MDINANKQTQEDCLISLKLQPELSAQLKGQSIAVIGGTGFVGTWIAELVAIINDKFEGNITLELLGRSTALWATKHPHLCRDDIVLRTQDVRSPFSLREDTTLVIYAAGIADPSIHASDAYKVYQTNVVGIENALHSASRLPRIARFLNISSGLAAAGSTTDAISERNIGILDFTRIQNMYAQSRRTAESLACIFGAQYRVPITTARAFTFIGPYQSIDAPWAINNFIRDAINGNNIRIRGDGSTRRGYLYGSDVAVWLLKIAVAGGNGDIYNVGGGEVISHSEVAEALVKLCKNKLDIVFTGRSTVLDRKHDFFPDLTYGKSSLNLEQAFNVSLSLERSMQWHSKDTPNQKK